MRPTAGQLVDQLGDRVGDAGPHRGDVEQVDPRHRLGRHGPQVGGVQALAGDALEQVGHQLVEALVGAGGSRKRPVGVVGQAAEHPGDVLERLALEQAGQQQVALLPQASSSSRSTSSRPGQQAAGLQLDERRRDQQELGGDVEVEDLQPLDLVQVGVDDLAQRDLVDIDLLSEDQVQQQVERPLEDGGRHRKCHIGSG